jgi:hypothetical protein
MTETVKNRIVIFSPKDDGTYVVEFRTAAGEALAISIPRTEARYPGTSRSVCPMAVRARCAGRDLRTPSTAVSQSDFSEWPEARASARSARTS